MQVLVDGAGRRVFQFSPYIDQSEMKRNVVLYDPNGYNIGTGLYDRTRGACGRWVDHFHNQEMKHGTRPIATIYADGATIRTPYYTGQKNHM